MNEEKKQTAEQWSTFWEGGSITTFLGRFENNYDSDILDFWQDELAKIPANSCLIDLATGNGALALIAARYSKANNKHLKITAVDYANIQPGSTTTGERDELMEHIKFLGNTSIENTGLKSETFDLAISQFGFEYGNAVDSVTELSRLLKTQHSKVILMIHHESSAILEQTRDGLAQYQLCQDPQFHEDIISLQTRLVQLRDQKLDPAIDKEAERLRESLNQRTGQLHEAQNNFKDPSQLAFYLESSMSIFNPQINGGKSVEEKSKLLTELRRQMKEYETRMEDLLAAAKSDSDIELLQNGLRNHGFSITKSESFEFENTPFAHIVIAER